MTEEKDETLEEQILKNIPEYLHPTKEQWERADQTLSVYILTQGMTEDNLPFWAYMAIPPSRYVPFKRAEQEGDLVLAEYGDIISMGIGHMPPESVARRMEEEFGINHNFENEVMGAVEEFLKEERVKEKYSGKKGREKLKERDAKKEGGEKE